MTSRFGRDSGSTCVVCYLKGRRVQGISRTLPTPICGGALPPAGACPGHSDSEVRDAYGEAMERWLVGELKAPPREDGALAVDGIQTNEGRHHE